MGTAKGDVFEAVRRVMGTAKADVIASFLISNLAGKVLTNGTVPLFVVGLPPGLVWEHVIKIFKMNNIFWLQRL